MVYWTHPIVNDFILLQHSANPDKAYSMNRLLSFSNVFYL